MNIVTYSYSGHVSLSTARDLINSFIAKGYSPVKAFSGKLAKLYQRTYKVKKAIAGIRKLDNDTFFVLMNIHQVHKLEPYISADNNGYCKYVYLFDAWPRYYDDILEAVSKYNIKTLFVPCKKSAHDINDRSMMCAFHAYWVPEGTVDSWSKPFIKNKDIDILNFGRRWNNLHEKIGGREDINYIYEKQRGQIIYNDDIGFWNALARSKYSVCVPISTIDMQWQNDNCEAMEKYNREPEDYSILTQRYFQSIIAGALIIGKLPRDGGEILGFNPVIDIEGWAEGRVVELINSYGTAADSLLINSYKQKILNNHTWDHRVEVMEGLI